MPNKTKPSLKADEFYTRIANLGLSVGNFVTITPLRSGIISKWKTLDAVPHWVSVLLNRWEKHPNILIEHLINSGLPEVADKISSKKIERPSKNKISSKKIKRSSKKRNTSKKSVASRKIKPVRHAPPKDVRVACLYFLANLRTLPEFDFVPSSNSSFYQLFILLHIEAWESSSDVFSTMVEKLKVLPTQLMRVITQLENRGLVEYPPTAPGQSVVRVTLTPRGRQVVDDVHAHFVRVPHQASIALSNPTPRYRGSHEYQTTHAW